MRKKIAALILSACISLLCFSACGSKPQKNNNGDNTVEIWSAPAAEKVLQVIPFSGEEKFNKYKLSGTYEILAVQNEYESGQIIITPEKDVSSYTVTVSDLKTASGEVLSKNCLKVYNQKYIAVTNRSYGSSTYGPGMYPDALLPFEKAAEYGENKIKAGENQGIWITVETGKSQAPGTYTGSFEINIDGVKYSVPASVTVIDYTLTDAVSTKTCFLLTRNYLNADGDTTFDNYSAIYNYMLDYRINVGYLPALPKDYDMYVGAMAEYADNPKFTSYMLPYSIAWSDTAGDEDLRYDLMETLLLKIAKYSIENNVNLIEKAYLYVTEVDEADQRGSALMIRAARIANSFENLKTKIAGNLASDNSFNGTLKNEIIESLRKIPNIQTVKMNNTLWNSGSGVKNYCPMFDEYNTESSREKYSDLADQGYEQWWYGCMGPYTPYPRYLIDDPLVSSRILSWMQEEYDVSGNLYWEIARWTKDFDAMDPYGNGNHTSLVSNPPNGDGFLIYPGSVYGMKNTPVGTIRLESIRDGMEEFEILNDINKTYKEITGNPDFSANDSSILQMLYRQLYTGTMVKADSLSFMSARKSMYELAVLAQNFDTAVIISEQGLDRISLEIVAPSGVEIKQDNTILSGVSYGSGKKRYEISVTFNKAKNYLNLTAEKDGESANLTLYLGGESALLNGVETDAEFEEFSANLGTLSKIDAETVFGNGREGLALKAVFAQSLTDRQYLRITSGSLKAISMNTESISFELFNASAQGFTLELYLKLSDKAALVPVGGSINAGQGINTITVGGFGDLSWGSGVSVEYIQINIGGRGDNKARTLYFDNIRYKGV